MLGFLDEQEGTNALGPLSTEAPAIAVYVGCRGTGTVDVQASSLGSFTAPCQVDPEGEGLRNVFDTRSIEGEFSVEVEGETGQQWAISITETTQDTPG
ncbi:MULTISPECIES: hypothetical protein [Arthrobacter]|uniref:Uncharacterized protein n=1 Tax=Arthrobacter bussei TaxID=2594179 RepID=A0A7X1NSI9_9MICC|nr:hypothetical protein [Arthrobacter bussei]MPY12239.1 hypothetical protein [Arthrobacter bussei]